MKKYCLLFVVFVLMVCVFSASAQKLEGREILPDGSDMLKYGNININITADDFLKTFEIGDIVTVTIEGYDPIDVPVCSNYDVFIGEKLLHTVSGQDKLNLAINNGQLGMELGIIETAPEGSAFPYQVREDAEFPITVTIEMKEKGGYAGFLGIYLLTRTNERKDYPELTDAEFANFREITTTGIAPKTLYRSSNPIKDGLGRDKYADEAAKEANIKTFINLADSKPVGISYDHYKDSYYSTQNVIYLALPVTLNTDVFRNGIAKGFRFIANNEGPYLFHCVEGRERAGFMAAVLEALMGATLEEIQDDYAKTYINYYDVKDGKQTEIEPAVLEAIREIIVRHLSAAFEIEELASVDLAEAAENYLLGIGLTAEEITALKAAIGELAIVAIESE